MVLLFLTVAALVVFLAVLSLLTIAWISEHGQLQRIGFDPAAGPFPLSVSDAFDAEHVWLWHTQVDALRLLAAGGKRGVTFDRVYRAYQTAAVNFPELYEGSSFAQWLFFLQRSELVRLTGYRVILTDSGKSLLQHCMQAKVLRAA